MEDLFDGSIRFIARVLLGIVRFISWLTWEIFCERILWYVGWPVARIFTLGKFPKQTIHDVDSSSTFNHFIVAAIGLAYPLLIIYFLNSWLAQTPV